jgi:hypothetical protein
MDKGTYPVTPVACLFENTLSQTLNHGLLIPKNLLPDETIAYSSALVTRL